MHLAEFLFRITAQNAATNLLNFFDSGILHEPNPKKLPANYGTLPGIYPKCNDNH